MRLCFELYPKLGSMGAVSRKLNEMGFRTKKYYIRGRKATGSTKFDKKKISGILSNPLYIGKISFKERNGKVHIFDAMHKPIITDPKVWEAVQNILVGNRDTRKTFKQNKYEMLFQGLIRCGACGSQMSNSSKRKKGKIYLYYRCIQAIAKGKEACPVRTIPGDEIETFLINEFKSLGKNPLLLRKSIEKANIMAKKGLGPLQKEKDSVAAQLSKINQDLRRIVDILKSEDLAQKRVQTLLNEISDLEASKEKLEKEINRIDTNMFHMSKYVIDAETFTKLFAEFPQVFETFSFEEKRNLILLLVKEIIYTPTKITVKFWGDLPELNFDIKNPPDWTPPPRDDGDGPYTPKGPHLKGVEVKNKGGDRVRLGVESGVPNRSRTGKPLGTVVRYYHRIPTSSPSNVAKPRGLF